MLTASATSSESAASAATTSGPARAPRPLLSLVCIAAGFAGFVIGAVDCLNFTVDDSFISLRFAENWASGAGLVFNPGERVEGFSNLLWTVLLGVLARFGVRQQAGPFELLIAAKLLGCAFAFGALVVLSLQLWAGRDDPDPERAHPLLALAVLGAGTTFSFALWSLSGMETGLCAFCVTLAGCLMLRALRRTELTGAPARGLFMAAGIAFGVLSLVRPEQIAIWGLALAISFLVGPSALRRPLLDSALPTLLVFAGLLAWRWSYYGQLVPNSVVAKWGGGATYVLLGAKYALAAVVCTVGVLGLAVLALPALLSAGADVRFLAAYCASYLAFIAVSGGDWMPGFRFIVPLVPLLWLLAVSAAVRLVDAAFPKLAPRTVALAVAGLAFASMMNGRALVRALADFPTGIKQRVWVTTPERIDVAKELSRLVPHGTTVAIGECGFVPYYAPSLRFLDVFGLMDPRIARLPGAHFSKLTLAQFLSRAPEFYMMMTRRLPDNEVVPTHPDGLMLLAAPEFRARYAVVRYFPGFTLYRRTGG